MFPSWLAFQGTQGTLYDACESNPVPINYFSSRAKTLRMLGTVRANVDVFWVDPHCGITEGMILKTAAGSYYLIVKVENDATFISTVSTLLAVNALEFTTTVQGYQPLPQTASSLSIYGSDVAGLPNLSKSVRLAITLSTDDLQIQIGGVLPMGALTALVSTCSGVQINDEYSWGGYLWRVDQVNPVEAAEQVYALQILLKQTKTQAKQIT